MDNKEEIMAILQNAYHSARNIKMSAEVLVMAIDNVIMRLRNIQVDNKFVGVSVAADCICASCYLDAVCLHKRDIKACNSYMEKPSNKPGSICIDCFHNSDCIVQLAPCTLDSMGNVRTCNLFTHSCQKA